MYPKPIISAVISHYSVRSERTGSIDAALRAGKKLAPNATKQTTAMTPKYAAGLLDVTPYRRLFINRRRPGRPPFQAIRPRG